jgi:hypothetical protein
MHGTFIHKYLPFLLSSLIEFYPRFSLSTSKILAARAVAALNLRQGAAKEDRCSIQSGFHQGFVITRNPA